MRQFFRVVCLVVGLTVFGEVAHAHHEQRVLGDVLRAREARRDDVDRELAARLVGVLALAAAARDSHQRDEQEDPPGHGAREHTTGSQRTAPVELALTPQGTRLARV